MYHGGRYYRNGYAAFMSPPIMRENNTCFLVFYYKLWRNGGAALSVLLEEIHKNTTTNGTYSTLLWTTNRTVTNWKKQTISLSQISQNYAVIFLGYYKSISYWQYSYVAVDDVQLISCDASKVSFVHLKLYLFILWQKNWERTIKLISVMMI